MAASTKLRKSIVIHLTMKLKKCCLALCFATGFAAIDLSGAGSGEPTRLISADLQQTNGPLNTVFITERSGTLSRESKPP